jgi:PiT family inorganic phosphate transporter
VITYLIVKPRVSAKVTDLENSRKDLNKLFTIPLIFAAALLSFAHGANDVANAVGPLAAVNDAITNLAISKKAAIPLWVMAVGGIGISIGLALFGPRLIKTVGSEITELDQMRAFSIMMAAAITVIIASQLGLPVSSTHIAVGAVFGVGFLREWMDRKSANEAQEKLEVESQKLKSIKAAIKKCKNDDASKKLELINKEKAQKKVIKKLKKTIRESYVKRGMVKKIVAAWVITVPAAAAVSAIIFFVIKGVGV